MKLHLGCGKRYLKGYIHVDIADFDHIDYKIPVDDLSIFKSEEVDEIYDAFQKYINHNPLP